MSINVDQVTDRWAMAYKKNFEGTDIAFVAVHHDKDGEPGPGLGIAVANTRGFAPIPKYMFAADRFDDAERKADALNESLHLTPEAVTSIVVSTMGGIRHYAKAE